MSDLKERFERAAAESKTLPERPDNTTMLELYSLYKQGSLGDVSGERPGLTDFVGAAKYDAWAARKGMSKEEARQRYVDLVEGLKQG